MKVITQIYLNCRPDLRDDWLTASEVDDVNEIIVSRLLALFCLGLSCV